MSTLPASAVLEQEDDSLAFMFGHDVTPTLQSGDELLDHELRITYPLCPMSTAETEALLQQDASTVPNDFLEDWKYDLNYPQYHQYGQACMMTAWSTAGLSSGSNEGQQHDRSLLHRSHSVLSGSSTFTFSPDHSMFPGSPWPQTPHSVPTATSSASTYETSLSPEVCHTTTSHTRQMLRWGYRVNRQGGWRCNFPRCRSKKTFYRVCDLHKHYNRHSRAHYCRKDPNCSQALPGGGFATLKDRARHEAKHNPNIECDEGGCMRIFSRRDNMRDHYRRIHKAPQPVKHEKPSSSLEV